MTGGNQRQVWVTSVLSGEDVSKALMLCYSLKRTYTTRKVAVIVSPKLPLNLRQALDHGFDLTFSLEEDRNTEGLKMEDFAKVYSLVALRTFEICAYLSPSLLAVKNCDKLFSGEMKGLVLMENPEDPSIFLFKPSMDNFKALMYRLGNLNDKNGNSLGTHIKEWANYQHGSSNMVSQKNKFTFTKNTSLIGYEKDIYMINMTNYATQDEILALEKVGILGRLVGNHWLKVYREDVLPLITNFSETSLLSTSPSFVYSKEPVAIIGMSCRLPKSNNLEEFWDLLYQGQDGISNPPRFRWLREQCSRQISDAERTYAGFLKVPVDQFDARFFGISPKEMVFMDPQHRLIHELVWEGLEDACLDPHTLRGTSGSVFLGSWVNDYKEIIAHSRNTEFYRGYMGNSIGAGAARISFLLGMTGPSVATESGCSSSIVAVHLACKALQNGETNLALAGGVNMLLNPFDKDEMPMVISSDGHCKTFSEDANGFARAEGGGVLVLKRLSDAINDGDHVWGLLRGSAMSQEGVSSSMGTPTVHCESLAMKEALLDARVAPEDISYVEAHGTGTTVGDPMEVAAIAEAYKSQARTEPLIIGSVKTNVGHTESCSGITGIIKVILSMHHETIPAHRNLTKLNPLIDLEAIPAVIPMKRMEWKKISVRPRIAGVSSFGITGTDAHVIVEEPPQLEFPKTLSVGDFGMERPLHILKISAKSEEAMNILLQKYKVAIHSSQHSLADICFSSNVGRANFPIRAAIIANTKEETCTKIDNQKYLRGEANTINAGKICFLFTGQGSQYSGMAKKLYHTCPVFQMHFDHCDNILRKTYNIRVTDVLWPTALESSNEITRTIYSQTSIFCVEYALLKVWESWGIKPDYALGHSLGEFCAAVCAGILSVEDAIKLVAERSRLIDELPRGKMLVIKAAQQEVDKEMRRFAGDDIHKLLDYAAVNSDQQTVVAGDSDVILDFSEYLNVRNMKNIVLAATHAFHSRHMDPMLSAYRKVEKATEMRDEKTCAYISGMRGDLISSEVVDADYWVQHTRKRVRFLNASRKAVELGCRVFIEIGPQPVLSALTMMNNDVNLMCLPSLKKGEEEWVTLLNTLGKLYVKGMEIDWSGIDQFHARKKVRLPHYPFIGKKFWPDLTQSTGNVIHPLIGSAIPNASSTKLFQCGLNIVSHEYIKDHAIGSTVVFPGAGYLEMCLASGLATVEGSTDSLNKPSRPMKVKNLSIIAPLALEHSKTCQLQSVVELNPSEENEQDWNDVSIKIFHRVETAFEGKWLQHVAATFSPIVTVEEQIVDFQKDAFLSTLVTPGDEAEIIDLYEKLASTGLKFGSAFKSLEKIWRNEDDTLLVKVKVPSDSESQLYVLHPIVLDAMIQAIMIMKLPPSKIIKKLSVPIKVGKFIWLPNGLAESEHRFIHVYKKSEVTQTGNEVAEALLLDLNGTVLAIMSDVEFIDTTVRTVESVLEQQITTMPEMWDEIWHPQVSPMQHRHDLNACYKDRIFYTNEYYNEIVEKYDKTSPADMMTSQNLEQLVYYNMLRALYQLGFQPTLGSTFSETELQRDLKVAPEFAKMFGYILTVLEDEKVLKSVKPGIWKVVKTPPTWEEIERGLASSTLTTDLVKLFKPTLLFIKVGENLSKILQGIQSALSILFPEETAKSETSSVVDFYSEFGILLKLIPMFDDVVRTSMIHCKKHDSPGRNIKRILEVGAGTGVFTGTLLELLVSEDIEFEYTYTDISAAFFPPAEKRFEKHVKNMTFKKLNIEEDPISQGFVPAYYDYIIASDVIHATKSVRETFGNIKILMKPGARFDMVEQTRVDRVITYLFGLLDGFWRFEDLDVRPNHCTLSTSGWTKVLESSGLELVKIFPCFNQHHAVITTRRNINDKISSQRIAEKDAKTWIIFNREDNSACKSLLQKFKLTNRNTVLIQQGFKFQNDPNPQAFTIRPDCETDFVGLMTSLENICVEGVIYGWSLETEQTTQEEILKPFFYLTKSILGMKNGLGLKLIVLTRGVAPLENNNFTNFQTSTIWGFVKSLQNERFELRCRCIDIGENESEAGALQIFYEIWNPGKHTQVGYQDTTRYMPKLGTLKNPLSDLTLPPGTNRFQLILPKTKSIGDLKFGPDEAQVLLPKEIEIQVKSTALNFRDVFSVLKPSEAFKDSNTVGLDFAGVVTRVHSDVTKWKVGDEVFGVKFNGDALPSHVKFHQNEVLQIPDGMTLNEACTLPTVVATSYYCLIDVAKIKSTDTVLIHTASGGVGLSAIEICKHIGATIIATAGSKRKQTYLRSLGIQHIFHSRNTEYGDQILKVTNGRGVDVVLNSLTSEGFKEATLKACAYGARFVEMSKLSVWSKEDVRNLRPDVEYTIVDIDVSPMSSEEWHRLLTKLKELTQKNVVHHIPYIRFNGVNIREALQYMQKAKHIGKVVCAMPEVKYVNGRTEIYTPMFNCKSTYLITGGLGGIGFEVCKWMVKMGAKYVLLAGRNPPNSSVAAAISRLNAENRAKVQAVELDVSNFDQCRQLLEFEIWKMGYPHLRGIMHAAGTLRDGLIENQTWESLSSTFNAKVKGTLNLHELTKNNSRLEHFVLFSSIVSLFGSPGQCNHAAGNQFEDTFAHYRNSMGLPATSINWGQWGEVGIATEVDVPGVKPFSNLHGLAGLEKVLKMQRTQTGIVNIESIHLYTKLHPQVTCYLDERVWKVAGESSGGSVAITPEEFWHQYDTMEDFKRKQDVVKEKLRIILRNTLKLEETDVIQDNGNFQELGVDSLMFVEIKNAIHSTLGDRVTVNVNVLRDCNTVELLSKALVQVIEGKYMKDNPPTVDEVAELIKEDIQLPESIRPRVGQRRPKIQDVSTVLITGVTGTLGLYVLRELSKRTNVTRIICLIRPKRNLDSGERLREILEDRDLLPEIDLNKVVCVNGNVSSPKLGMEDELYSNLSDSVDAVFHCAASVQHIEFYSKKHDNPTSMRAVNIQGLKNVLKFCCSGGKLKHIYNASAMLAIATLNEEGNLSEDWPKSDDYNGVTKLAYPNTKFVGDFIMGEAITQRGIPGKVFRFPFITGDSRTGRFVLDQNHLMLRYIFIMKDGIMPSNPFPLPALPVDICAKLSMELFFNPEAPDDIYNITNQKVDADQEFISVAKRFGYAIQIVELSEFSKRIQETTAGDDSPMAMFKDFYTNEEGLMSLYTSAPFLKQWVLDSSSKEEYFMSKKLAKWIPEYYESCDGKCSSMDYIYRDILFAKRNGWLEKFGL